MAHDARGYYKLLNLEPGSGIEEVRLAYRFLKYAWEKEGSAPHRKVNEAHACLGDRKRKALYDAQRGDMADPARYRDFVYTVLLVVLIAFAALVFPGFLKPSLKPFGSGDRLNRTSTGFFFGEVVRREQSHKFPKGQTYPGYLVRLPDGEQRWYPASDLERHFHK